MPNWLMQRKAQALVERTTVPLGEATDASDPHQLALPFRGAVPAFRLHAG